jgi:hypothetical protein
MIPIGWSAGDLIAGIGVVTRVYQAFKEAGGSEAKYREAQDFLDGLRSTLEILKAHVENLPDGLSDRLTSQIERVDRPWKEFQCFVKKYEKSLSEPSSSLSTKIKKASSIVRWAAKDLMGEVQKLDAAIAQPLRVLNTLLLIQTPIMILEKLDATVGEQQAKLEHITEAIRTHASKLRLEDAVQQEANYRDAAEDRAALTKNVKDNLHDLHTSLDRRFAKVEESISQQSNYSAATVDGGQQLYTEKLEDMKRTLQSIREGLETRTQSVQYNTDDITARTDSAKQNTLPYTQTLLQLAQLAATLVTLTISTAEIRATRRTTFRVKYSMGLQIPPRPSNISAAGLQIDEKEVKTYRMEAPTAF